METESRRKSEEVFKELEVLESGRDGMERKWMLLNNSPELSELVQRLLVAERIDPAGAKSLQTSLAEKLKGRDREKEGWLKEWGEKRNELFKLTQPVIMESVREIDSEIGKVRSKRVSNIISKKYSGLAKTTFLRICSNDEAIRAANTLAKEGTTGIQAMYFSTIPKIEEATKILIEKIRAIDLSVMVEKEVREEIYFKGKAPEGLSPATMEYNGPLSGLDLPPIKGIN